MSIIDDLDQLHADATPGKGSESRSCHSCKHFGRWTESWEMPWVRGVECRKRPGIENLRNFPFRNTRCAKWRALVDDAKEEK